MFSIVKNKFQSHEMKLIPWSIHVATSDKRKQCRLEDKIFYRFISKIIIYGTKCLHMKENDLEKNSKKNISKDIQHQKTPQKETREVYT